ncbi:MAG: hypothetical protein ABIA11_03880 [Patescibacteria group bacterium]
MNVALFPELRKCSPSNYKYVKYNSDAIAGKLAGETHDIGNSLMHRFADKNMFAGHPEIGAALVWYFAKDIFGDHLALLIAWAVAAHQHLTKPLKIGEYTRDTYPVEIFEVGREIVGIAPVIARFCDRLDTGGGISQLPRTFTSRADSVEEGVDGHDVVPGSNEDMKFFEINRANLTAKFWPIIRPKEEQKEGDSIVEHLLMYCGSSTGITVYSENDYRFPLAQQLMLERVVESKEILNLMVNLPRRKANPEEEEKAKELFKNFLLKSMVSNQGDFGRIWRLLEEIWDEQTPETKYVWFATLPKMDAEYDRWIKRLYQVVVDSGYWLAEFSGEVVKEMLST